MRGHAAAVGDVACGGGGGRLAELESVSGRIAKFFFFFLDGGKDLLRQDSENTAFRYWACGKNGAGQEERGGGGGPASLCRVESLSSRPCSSSSLQHRHNNSINNEHHAQEHFLKRIDTDTSDSNATPAHSHMFTNKTKI